MQSIHSPNDVSIRQMPQNTAMRNRSAVGERQASNVVKEVRVIQLKTRTSASTTIAKAMTKAPRKTTIRIPDTPTLQRMSHLALQKFYHSYVNSPQVPCSAVERMGSVNDGGWEMCDDPLYRPDEKNCLVYSFGINYDFSYDDDIAEYGCDVYAFDPSMREFGNHLRGKKIHFFKIGIGDRDNYTVNGVNGKWILYSLKGLRERFGHKIGQRQVDIVKMDIDGREIQSLTQALKDGSLDDVRQLSFEAHLTLNGNPTKKNYIKFLTQMRGIYEAGFRIYATHRNHVHSAFKSELTGKQRTTCHEINTVNVHLRRN